MSNAPEQSQKTAFHILVNSREKVAESSPLTYDQIVDFAFPTEPQRREILYKIHFTSPHLHDGTVGIGQSQQIENGMKFDVTPTNRS